MPEPIDVYFLVDTSGSFSDDLPVFQAEAPAIINEVESRLGDVRFGLGRFEDYPIFPFGSAATGDKAYRVVDLTSDTTAFLDAITGLSTRFGGWPPRQR